ALAARTEGWAAGLQLAGLSLRGRDDAAGFVAAFTGSHRYVLDYLAEEVLEQQPGPVREFLLDTSVLERLSGDLCDAVTGRPGSQELLEQAERAGLFVVPLDEVRGWWRYHHLFADLLRARLQAEHPGRVRDLHRNAAAWYADRGLPDDAIRHAIAAGELTWAARLIEEHFDEVFYLRGEGATFHRWLSALPAEVVRSRPRLLVAQAFLASHSGDGATVQPLLDAAEQAYPGTADEPFEPTVGPVASILVNVPALIALSGAYLAQFRGDAEATAAFAARALAESRPDNRVLVSIIQWNLAVAEWLGGRLPAAERAFFAAIARWREDDFLHEAWGCHDLGRVQRALGRLDAAVRTCQRALDADPGPGRAQLPVAGAAYVGLAEVAYQRNELDRALAEVTRGIALCRQLAWPPPLACGLVRLAWIRQAAGDPAGARDAMDQAAQAAPGPPGLLNPVQAQRARLLLAQGDVSGAAAWTDKAGLSADDEPAYA
ncbi:MAG: hypothetical protein ACRDPF_21170, partial [Streptosporangiaceae bacterium]